VIVENSDVPVRFQFSKGQFSFLNFEAQQAFRIMGDIPLDASNIAVSSDISSVMYISSVMDKMRFLNFELDKFYISVVSAKREVTLRPTHK